MNTPTCAHPEILPRHTKALAPAVRYATMSFGDAPTPCRDASLRQSDEPSPAVMERRNPWENPPVGIHRVSSDWWLISQSFQAFHPIDSLSTIHPLVRSGFGPPTARLLCHFTHPIAEWAKVSLLPKNLRDPKRWEPPSNYNLASNFENLANVGFGSQ